jgi:hypothetical protein
MKRFYLRKTGNKRPAVAKATSPDAKIAFLDNPI